MRKPANSWDERLIQRVTGEYLEMPGLRLTTAQAQRLWNLDQLTCQSLLNALIDLKFLVRTSDGRYARPTDGPSTTLARQAKADLAPRRGAADPARRFAS